jgi:hypothetical protein
MTKMKYILIFIGNLDYSAKCDQIIEYSTDMHQKDTRIIPDEYIELIKYWTGHHFHMFSDFQTYPDNWGCHNKEIVSFIFNKRYCELSELFDDNTTYLSVRIYPSDTRNV